MIGETRGGGNAGR